MYWLTSNAHKPAELIRRAPSGRFRSSLEKHLNSLPIIYAPVVTVKATESGISLKTDEIDFVSVV
jgi:hypothetical protein